MTYMAEEVGVEPTSHFYSSSTALKAARPTGGDALPRSSLSKESWKKRYLTDLLSAFGHSCHLIFLTKRTDVPEPKSFGQNIECNYRASSLNCPAFYADPPDSIVSVVSWVSAR